MQKETWETAIIIAGRWTSSHKCTKFLHLFTGFPPFLQTKMFDLCCVEGHSFIDVISRKRISFKQRQNVLTSCNDSCPAILDITTSLFWARHKNTCGIHQTPATKIAFRKDPEFWKNPEFIRKTWVFL